MVPVFNSMIKEFVLDQTEVSVDENGEVKLTASLKDIAGGIITHNSTWTSSDEAVATVANGALTIVGIGNTTITAQYGSYSATCEVEITEAKLPVEDKTSVTLTLEAKNEASLEEQLMAEALKAGLFASFEVASITDVNGEEVAENFIATADANNNRELTLIVYSTEIGYKVNVLVITKVIRTAEELTKLQEYAGVTTVDATYNQYSATYYNYGGYFVLGNDIIVEDSDAVISASCLGQVASQSQLNVSNGFSGVFDGRGHSIVNAKFGAGGLLGDVSKTGVIKNVAFVDATITQEAVTNAGAGVVAYSFNGTAENLFVSYTTLKARNGAFGRATKGAALKDVVVYYKKSGGYNGAALVSWLLGDVTLDNVYVVYANGMADGDCKLNHDGAGKYIGTATQIKEADLASATFSGLDTDLWLVVDGMMPIFRSAIGDLSLSASGEVEVELGQELSFTAGIQNIGGTVMSYFPVTWESSDEAVATVVNGVLTLLQEGSTTISVSFGAQTKSVVVNVLKPEIPVEDKTSVTLTLEAKNEASLAEQLIAEGVKAGLFASFEVASVTDINGEEIAANFIATADASNTREVTLFVYAENIGYKVNVLVVTKVIRTAEELTKLQDYAGYTTVDASYNATYTATYYNYGGYFVLGNDIIVEDSDAVISARCLEQLASGSQIKVENGFSGVFDGRGHSIVNAKFGAGGLLGDVSKTGVIKNVAFVNATISQEAKGNAGAAVVAYSFCGTAENVFVSYTTLKARNGAFGRVTKGGTFKDIVIYYKKSGGYNGAALASWLLGDVTVNNVYAVYANGMADADCKVNHDGDGKYIGTVTQIKEADLASATFSGLDTNLWFVEAGMMPIFKSAVKELVLDKTSVSVDTNGEVKLTASLKDIAGNVIPANANWTSSDEAIATVTNGLLNLLAAGSVTITAEIGGYRATCEVEIAEAELVVTDKTGTTLYLETANNASLAEQVVESGVKAGLFASFEAVSVTDVNGEELAEDFIAAADASNNRAATLIVYSTAKAYKVDVFVVTKAIRTAQELVDIIDYATNVTEISKTYSNVERKTYSYDGYFVLANNIKQDSNNPITFAGPSLGTANDQKVININSGNLVTKNGSEGFHGTFDGQGYAIDGFSYGVGGVFGFIGSGAVIKNVAFTNCATGDGNSTTRNESVLAQGAIGSADSKWLIENVYVQGTMNGLLSGMLLGYWAYDGTISNTVVQVKYTGSIDRIASISWEKNNGFAVNNFVGAYEYDAGRYGRDYKPFAQASVHTAPASWTLSEYEIRDGAVRKITAKTYNGENVATYTLAESAPTAEEFAAFSSDYWTVEAGKTPVYKAKN